MEDELIIKFLSDDEVDSKSRFAIRRAFWGQLLPQLKNTSLFSNVSPSKDHWLSTGAGTTGLSYTMIITRKYTAIEFYISRASKQENKIYYNQLLQNKKNIEDSFGAALSWEELPNNKASRIRANLHDVSLYNNEDWSKMTEFLVENLPKFENAFHPIIEKIRL
jgi:hypothetical protein